ncbi:MAG: DUF4386 family protein [Actinomycetota bacterium]
MSEQRWERLGASTGIVFVVLAFASFFIGGELPKPGDSAQQVVAYYTSDSDKILWSGWLWGLAGIAFLWFLGSLRSQLVRAEGDPGRLTTVVFAGGIVGGAVYSIGVSISSALAFGIAQNAPVELSDAFSDLATHLYNGAAFAFFVFVAATSLISGRTKLFPAWLGWFGWLVALLTLAASLTVVVDSGPFATGEIVSILSFFGFFLWFLALAVTVTRQAGKEPART